MADVDQGPPFGPSIYRTLAERIAVQLTSNHSAHLFSGEARSAIGALYGGPLGTALFLALAGRFLGRDDFMAYARELAGWGVIKPRPGLLGEQWDLCQGVAGRVYGDCVLADALDEPERLETARVWAGVIRVDSALAHLPLDFLGGALGLQAALCRLAERLEMREMILEGERVLADRIEAELLPRPFGPDRGRHCLAGFSHGIAGAVFTLALSYQHTRSPRILPLIATLVSREHEAWDDDARGWRDYRHRAPRFTNAWCHGATGIGLSRLPLLDVPELSSMAKDDIARAIALNLTQPLAAIDNLCCGTLGRVELLLAAGRAHGDASFTDAASRVTDALCQKIFRHRRLDNGRRGPITGPELFQGLSGVGWQLLRMAYPKTVPSLLLFELPKPDVA